MFEASHDTVEMMQALLTEAGACQSLIACPFAALRRGIIDAIVPSLEDALALF